MTTIHIYVVDTSYLLELFRVPKDSTDESHAKVKSKFSEANERGDRLYVPLPVLFPYSRLKPPPLGGQISSPAVAEAESL